MRFASGQRETNRQATGIDDCMNLGRQSASRPAHQLFTITSDAGSVLMHAHNGRINHLHGRIMACGQRIHKLVPHASPAPANKSVVAGGVRAKVLRQIAPRRTPSVWELESRARRDHQTTKVLRVLGCVPRLDGATGSSGRRPRSLRGGNRGPCLVRRCRAVGLWGFERRGPSLVVWAMRWQGVICGVRLWWASTREQWSRCERAS